MFAHGLSKLKITMASIALGYHMAIYILKRPVDLSGKIICCLSDTVLMNVKCLIGSST